jgi:bacterioferritin
MKGNPKVIEALNGLIKDEFTAYNEYLLHANRAILWGYDRLAAVLKEHAEDEAKHVNRLIQRVIFLMAEPYVAQLGTFQIGKDVPKMIAGDLSLEHDAQENYNKALELAQNVKDIGTFNLLKDNLADEEDHIADLESFEAQIEQMGLDNFLSGLTGVNPITLGNVK